MNAIIGRKYVAKKNWFDEHIIGDMFICCNLKTVHADIHPCMRDIKTNIISEWAMSNFDKTFEEVNKRRSLRLWILKWEIG